MSYCAERTDNNYCFLLAYKCFILVLGTTVGLVLSIDLTWIEAMKACAKNGQAPFDPSKNYKPDKKWTGTFKYGKIF